tara:strand:+ start:482 stop:1759 length:1278 start_codon:yes stop_codon:yes gene_type:complete
MKYFASLLFLILGYCFFFFGYQNINLGKEEKQKKVDLSDLNENLNNYIPNEKEKLNNENIIKKNLLNETIIKVEKNQTFSNIIKKYISSNQLVANIINEIEKKYSLRKLREGQKIYLYQKKNNNNIEKIKIPIENNVDLNITIDENIEVEKKHLKIEYENNSKEYFINNSLFADGVDNNIPKDILTKLIKLYSFDLDFQRDIRKNTKVSVSYEIKIIEGRDKYFYGDINYGLIEIGNNKLEYFKFKTDDGFIDYFNRKGENVKKSILKTPLDGAKLSSGFGMRTHPISGFNKMHKGVDFAAPTGTPVFAGGNGTIDFAGRNGGYGKYIRIRHNNEYKTAYAHLSNFKKGISKGVRVNQGDVIGFVGSTGNSTGPHLHYEIIFQNKQINPLKLKLPSGKKLKGNELKRYISEMKIIYANHLNLLFE